MIEAVKGVDWLEQVLEGFVHAVAADPTARTVGVADWQLQQTLVGQQTPTGPIAEALGDAVPDLERLGFASRRGNRIELTQAGRESAAEDLRKVWPHFMGVYLDNEQLALLMSVTGSASGRLGNW